MFPTCSGRYVCWVLSLHNSSLGNKGEMRRSIRLWSRMRSRSSQSTGICLLKRDHIPSRHRETSSTIRLRDIIRESVRASQAPCSRGSTKRKFHPGGVSHGYHLLPVQRRGRSLVLLGHMRPALWIQVSHQEFYCSTERVIPMLDAGVFQQSQHAINISRASDMDGLFGQFIHGSERACEPVSVGEIEPVTPGLEEGLTRFSTKFKCHIIALRITPSHRNRHQR